MPAVTTHSHNIPIPDEPPVGGGVGTALWNAANSHITTLNVDLSTEVFGVLPVAKGGLGITSGNSGGIPYFSSTTTIGSSGPLANNSLIVGQGVGAAPVSIAAGTDNTVLKGVTGSQPTFGKVALASDVSGLLPKANGGTGRAATYAFSAYNTTPRTNVTGDGTVYTLTFDGEIFDTNNNFTGNTYTAPSTDKYQFNVATLVQNITALHTACVLSIATSNRTYEVFAINPGTARDFNNNLIISGSVTADMDAGDTATATLAVYSSTKTIGVFGGASGLVDTVFSGFLVT
jgi:hypothetical protein